MADITNNDILNAIIGRYQNNPNRVSDAVLQQKVDALKAELENVKSELQNMNTKLAGTLETELKGADIFTDTNPGSVQLTGSNVREIPLFLDTTITAGNSQTIADVDVSDCEYFRVVLYEVNNETRKYTITIRPYGTAISASWPIGYARELLKFDGETLSGADDQFSDSTPPARRCWSKIYRPMTPRVSFVFQNDDTNDTTIRLYLMKLGGVPN